MITAVPVQNIQRTIYRTESAFRRNSCPHNTILQDNRKLVFWWGHFLALSVNMSVNLSRPTLHLSFEDIMHLPSNIVARDWRRSTQTCWPRRYRKDCKKTKSRCQKRRLKLNWQNYGKLKIVEMNRKERKTTICDPSIVHCQIYGVWRRLTHWRS